MSHIAIIDDDIDSNQLLDVILSRYYTISTYENAEDGLTAFEKLSPDLILLDISMPGKTGEEILTILKNNPKLNKIHVLALTGYSMPGQRAKFLKLGFSEHIAKPIEDIESLIHLIKRFLTP